MFTEIIERIKFSLLYAPTKNQLYEANKKLCDSNMRLYEQYGKLREENSKLEDELMEHKKEISRLYFIIKDLKENSKES